VRIESFSFNERKKKGQRKGNVDARGNKKKDGKGSLQLF